MKATRTRVPDVLLCEPRLFPDRRGVFFESYNRRVFRDATGLDVDFVQDNHSRSSRGVVRGLHYQIEQAQGKLVRAVCGEIFDVAVDLRRSSKTFGRWAGEILSAENALQLWIPPGFAHAFMVLSDSADVLYKATDYYAPRHERSILWDDPDLAIDWPLDAAAIISEKDRRGVPFAEADYYD